MSLKSAAFSVSLVSWIETLVSELLHRIWTRYNDARDTGDERRARSIYLRFLRLVDKHNWFPCRIEWHVTGQLVVSAAPREDDDCFLDQEEFA